MRKIFNLPATDRYEFWRKNEVAFNQRRFNVKFCAGFLNFSAALHIGRFFAIECDFLINS